MKGSEYVPPFVRTWCDWEREEMSRSLASGLASLYPSARECAVRYSSGVPGYVEPKPKSERVQATVREVLRRVHGGETVKDVAREMGVPPTTLVSAVRRWTGRSVTELRRAS